MEKNRFEVIIEKNIANRGNQVRVYRFKQKGIKSEVIIAKKKYSEQR